MNYLNGFPSIGLSKFEIPYVLFFFAHAHIGFYCAHKGNKALSQENKAKTKERNQAFRGKAHLLF